MDRLIELMANSLSPNISHTLRVEVNDIIVREMNQNTKQFVKTLCEIDKYLLPYNSSSASAAVAVATGGGGGNIQSNIMQQVKPSDIVNLAKTLIRQSIALNVMEFDLDLKNVLFTFISNCSSSPAFMAGGGLPGGIDALNANGSGTILESISSSSSTTTNANDLGNNQNNMNENGQTLTYQEGEYIYRSNDYYSSASCIGCFINRFCLALNTEDPSSIPNTIWSIDDMINDIKASFNPYMICLIISASLESQTENNLWYYVNSLYPFSKLLADLIYVVPQHVMYSASELLEKTSKYLDSVALDCDFDDKDLGEMYKNVSDSWSRLLVPFIPAYLFNGHVLNLVRRNTAINFAKLSRQIIVESPSAELVQTCLELFGWFCSQTPYFNDDDGNYLETFDHDGSPIILDCIQRVVHTKHFWSVISKNRPDAVEKIAQFALQLMKLHKTQISAFQQRPLDFFADEENEHSLVNAHRLSGLALLRELLFTRAEKEKTDSVSGAHRIMTALCTYFNHVLFSQFRENPSSPASPPDILAMEVAIYVTCQIVPEYFPLETSHLALHELNFDPIQFAEFLESFTRPENFNDVANSDQKGSLHRLLTLSSVEPALIEILRVRSLWAAGIWAGFIMGLENTPQRTQIRLVLLNNAARTLCKHLDPRYLDIQGSRAVSSVSLNDNNNNSSVTAAAAGAYQMKETYYDTRQSEKRNYSNIEIPNSEPLVIQLYAFISFSKIIYDTTDQLANRTSWESELYQIGECLKCVSRYLLPRIIGAAESVCASLDAMKPILRLIDEKSLVEVSPFIFPNLIQIFYRYHGDDIISNGTSGIISEIIQRLVESHSPITSGQSSVSSKGDRTSKIETSSQKSPSIAVVDSLMLEISNIMKNTFDHLFTHQLSRKEIESSEQRVLLAMYLIQKLSSHYYCPYLLESCLHSIIKVFFQGYDQRISETNKFEFQKQSRLCIHVILKGFRNSLKTEAMKKDPFFLVLCAFISHSIKQDPYQYLSFDVESGWMLIQLGILNRTPDIEELNALNSIVEATYIRLEQDCKTRIDASLLALLANAIWSLYLPKSDHAALFEQGSTVIPPFVSLLFDTGRIEIQNEIMHRESFENDFPLWCRKAILAVLVQIIQLGFLNNYPNYINAIGTYFECEIQVLDQILLNEEESDPGLVSQKGNVSDDGEDDENEHDSNTDIEIVDTGDSNADKVLDGFGLSDIRLLDRNDSKSPNKSIFEEPALPPNMVSSSSSSTIGATGTDTGTTSASLFGFPTSIVASNVDTMLLRTQLLSIHQQIQQQKQ